MNRFTILTFFRSLTRHKLYAAINIGGLAVGIAVFLVLGLYVRFETSYEHWLPDYPEIYQIQSLAASRGGDVPYAHNGPIALWSAVSREVPGVAGTRIRERAATVLKDGVGVSEDMSLVDRDFGKVFRLPMVSGDLNAALADPTAIVVNQTIARKYFGSADPIGKTMTMVRGGKAETFHVAAVMKDPPANTDLTLNILAQLRIPPNDGTLASYDYYQWNYWNVSTYVRLPDRAAAVSFNDRIKTIIGKYAANETISAGGEPYSMKSRLTPIADVHSEQPGAKIAVVTLGVVGALTLIMAIVNYVNLATARAGLRAREVAMRKVLGADRGTIMRHYVGEAMATTLMAGVIGLALTELALPLVNAVGDIKLTLAYVGAEGVLLPLAAIVAVVGVASGLYPAVLMSRFPAAAVLASARTPGGGRAGTRIREALVVGQFVIAIAFIIGTFVLVAQVRHVRTADVGYQRDGLMLVMSMQYPSLTDGQRDTLLHRFAALPGVASTSVANNVPGFGTFRAETSVPVKGVPGDGPSLRKFQVTPGFFGTMGAHLLAGRLFDASRGADIDTDYQSATSVRPYNIIVNRTALAALHVASPQAAIGRTFAGPGSPPRTIVGVVDDMRFDDARTPIPPTFYEFVVRAPESAVGILRFAGDPKALAAAARAVWLQVAPEVPFEAKTADQNLARLYTSDDRTAHLFTIGAVLAVLIGCVGLWGLASFNTARRVKEIGIRKTLGASSADIVKLLVGQFLRPVLIANLFAWPLAYFAMRTWLTGFNDRIALSPLFFVAATVLALLIAVLTVLAQSLRAARSAPAWALRHD